MAQNAQRLKMLGAAFEQAPANVVKVFCDAIQNGETVVAATETGFCYFGCAGKKTVLEKFLCLREAHPKQKPFSLMFSSLAQVSQFAEMQTPAFRLASKLLPGPFTIILPSTRNTPQNALVKTKNTVGVRLTKNALVNAVCTELNSPLLVSSVTDNDELLEEHYFNSLGEIWQDAWWANSEAIAQFLETKFSNDQKLGVGGLVSYIVDPGEDFFLRSSTVIDFSEGRLEIIRNSGWEMNI